jgi:hypothetical protein
LAQRAVVQPVAIARRDFALAAHRMDAIVERRVGALGGVNRHRVHGHRRVEDALQPLRGMDGHRRRALRAVEERQSFLRSEIEDRQAGTRQTIARRQSLPIDDHLCVGARTHPPPEALFL